MLGEIYRLRDPSRRLDLSPVSEESKEESCKDEVTPLIIKVFQSGGVEGDREKCYPEEVGRGPGVCDRPTVPLGVLPFSLDYGHCVPPRNK